VTRKVPGCGYAEQLVVAPDGTVYPCHLLDGALGHIDDAPVTDILAYLGRTARAFDNEHTLGCNTCDLRSLCGGTCRVNNGKVNGSRLITTCTPEEREEKYRSIVRAYGTGEQLQH
jgi:radical SAM protein with 4Fe4S-binding SPASM domain